MIHQKQNHGVTIITGASRGIGAEYARVLASQGHELLLIGRDESQLQAVSEEITTSHDVKVSTQCLDLSLTGSAHQLFVAARDCQKPVDMLINNAGFGLYGEFVNMPLPRIQDMLQLHINTVVESTRLFLPAMIERQSGTIINIASIAGFLPVPYMAEYAATKAFLISFSEALAEEVRGSGVVIQTCCPGSTDTNFHNTAGHRPANPLGSQTAQEVVQTSLDELKKKRPHVTIGWQGWLSDRLTRFLPRTLMIRLAGNRVKPLPRQ